MLKISESSDITFENIIRDSMISESLKTECAKADILLLPPDLKEILYPEITGDLYQYLKNNLPSDMKVEIPVEDEDYKETRYYEPIEIIANLLITGFALPIVTKIISHFLIKRMERKAEKQKARLTFIVDNKDGIKSKTLKFEGNSEDFKEFMENINKIYKKE